MILNGTFVPSHSDARRCAAAQLALPHVPQGSLVLRAVTLMAESCRSATDAVFTPSARAVFESMDELAAAAAVADDVISLDAEAAMRTE